MDTGTKVRKKLLGVWKNLSVVVVRGVAAHLNEHGQQKSIVQ